MGGRGSGRQEGHGFMVDKCHEIKSIDIAWLRRRKRPALIGSPEHAQSELENDMRVNTEPFRRRPLADPFDQSCWSEACGTPVQGIPSIFGLG